MKDELIAEMLEDICPNSLTSKCSLCWAHYECVYKQLARTLVEKGYRKQTEVAKIFAEIEYLIRQYDTHPASELTEELAELKNKYIGGVGE